MKLFAATSFLFLALSPARASTPSSQSGAKTPGPLPEMQDIKTPEPPSLTGPGLLVSPAATDSHASPTRHVGKSAPASVLRMPRHEIDHVLVDASNEGVIWARGRSYKARFGDDGATYVPFFGSNAPANHPVSFATSSARIGSTAIECNAVAPVRDGETISFVRGGFVESWHMGLEGMEQKFSFAALPATGDLVITIGTQTDLEPSCAGGVIAFTNELGRVDYGAAVAIDASGRRFAMSSAFAAGSIELRLDRADVARATLPVVVDPIVTTFPMLNAALTDFAPDVAYDASTGRYLIVYEEAFTDLDHDIYAELRDSVGNYVSADYIDYTTDYWEMPRVAYNAVGVEFMCVAAVGGFPNLRTIKGRFFSPVTSTMSAQITIAGADGYDKSSPDVGGDPEQAPPTYFFVVWERAFSALDHDIHGRLVQIDGSLRARARSSSTTRPPRTTRCRPSPSPTGMRRSPTRSGRSCGSATRRASVSRRSSPRSTGGTAPSCTPRTRSMPRATS